MGATHSSNRGKVPADWESEGGSLLDAAACAEPVVLSLGKWERESRQADGSERGVRELVALSCAEDRSDALAICGLVASILVEDEWPQSGGWRWRVVAVDVADTEDKGRDGSGRWVCALTLRVTLVHEAKNQESTG